MDDKPQESKKEIALALASNTTKPVWAAQKLLSDERYKKYLNELGEPEQKRQALAWEEYMHNCGLVNDDARESRLLVFNAPWPQSEAECAIERKAREETRAAIYAAQDEQLKQLRKAYLMKVAEIKNDWYDHCLQVLLRFIEETP